MREAAINLRAKREQRDLIDPRKRLRDLHPAVFAAYMRRR